MQKEVRYVNHQVKTLNNIFTLFVQIDLVTTIHEFIAGIYIQTG